MQKTLTGYTGKLKGKTMIHSKGRHSWITQSGLRIQTGFQRNPPTGDQDLLNNINQQTRVARLHWSNEGHVFGGAWWPGTYEETRFSMFLKA